MVVNADIGRLWDLRIEERITELCGPLDLSVI